MELNTLFLFFLSIVFIKTYPSSILANFPFFILHPKKKK